MPLSILSRIMSNLSYTQKREVEGIIDERINRHDFWSNISGLLDKIRLEQQIKEILEREMPGSRVEVERDSESEKIGGRVTWEGFAGQNSLRRQRKIFGALRRQLRASDEREISFIFTSTPNEDETMQAMLNR